MLALHELDLISEGSHDLLMYWIPKTLVLLFPILGTKGRAVDDAVDHLHFVTFKGWHVDMFQCASPESLEKQPTG